VFQSVIVGGAVLLGSLVLSKLGIIGLVAKGYGTLAWGFFTIFTVPLITIGVRKIQSTTRPRPPARGSGASNGS
jgi:uncharacterized membrane protein YkvI